MRLEMYSTSPLLMFEGLPVHLLNHEWIVNLCAVVTHDFREICPITNFLIHQAFLEIPRNYVHLEIICAFEMIPF